MTSFYTLLFTWLVNVWKYPWPAARGGGGGGEWTFSVGIPHPRCPQNSKITPQGALTSSIAKGSFAAINAQWQKMPTEKGHSPPLLWSFAAINAQWQFNNPIREKLKLFQYEKP